MFGNILNYILGLGAAIFLPIIMILIGLGIKMKFKRAVISGLTLGVAFTGMNVILGFMFDTISPVAGAFVEKTGIQLNIIDVGWSPMSAIAWAWPYALFMFPLQIGINLLMLIFKQTDILNVDLWNVWGKIFTATMVAAITGNIALGFVAAAIQVIVELKIGEATQKRTQEITGIPGVTCTHYMVLQCVIMEPVNKLLDYIPIFKKENSNADKLKDKIGIFGENSVMGFIIGALIAILAGYTVKDTLDVAIKVATALVLFPMVAKLFMQALAPIADAASEFMKSKFKDREIYIGLDWLEHQTRDPSEASVRRGIRFGLMREWPQFGLRADIRLGRRQFRQTHFFFPVVRSDRETQLNLSLWHPKLQWHGLMPRLTYRYLNINSNIPELYQRRSRQWFIEVERRF